MMDYFSEKLNSLTGEALSGVNELKRKRKQQLKHQQSTKEEMIGPHVEDDHGDDETRIETSANTNLYAFQSTVSNRAHLSGGIPFGGDTFIPQQIQPPPIGFRSDLLESLPVNQQHSTTSAKNLQFAIYKENNETSNQSLYETDTWTRLWFQRVMILSLIRLLLFIRKVYEDYQATKTYNISGQMGHFFVSATTLFLPTIVFTIYRVSRYLQINLPTSRALAQNPYLISNQKSSSSLEDNRVSKVSKSAIKNQAIKNDEDVQLTRALMGTTSAACQHEDDGLVTARQTPTNFEEYHDSKSEQEQTVAINIDGGVSSPAPSTAIVKNSSLPQPIETIYKETIDVDKLGDIPDKETTRVVIGASEQILHGVLFVFWQLKRQVDVLGYLVERSCLWRAPSEKEKEELGRLRTGSDGLEWFQDFYAAFLAILTQVYTLGLHWASNDDKSSSKASTLNSAAIGASVSGFQTIDSSSELAISNTAKIISDTLHHQALAGNEVNGKDLLIISELLVSSAVVFSLLVAVRRRDDGILTLGLSMLGWGSIFASRIIIIALAFVHIGWKIMLPLVCCHILGITTWIYKIAIDSHNGKKSESEESKWDADLTDTMDIDKQKRQSTELESEASIKSKTKHDATTIQDSPNSVTSQWSIMEHITLISQIITLFAIPSLFYWPIMFNLKLHCRPFKYLVLILSENFILIPTIWLSISSLATPGQWLLLSAVGGFSIIGFIFVSLYVSCKPSLTEYFARADELFNEAEKSGIYFEFCSRAFKMPDLSKQTFRRLMNQSEQQVEEQIEQT